MVVEYGRFTSAPCSARPINTAGWTSKQLSQAVDWITEIDLA